MNDIFLGAVLTVFVCAAVAALTVLVLRQRATEPEAEDPRLDDLSRQNAETAARLESMIGMLAKGQSQFQHQVSERLDSVGHHLNQSMATTRQHTVESLTKLNERLAVIDRAQKNISDLSTQVTSLQQMLSNKQTRGAFGQAQLEALVADVLPKGAYAFQYKLSNGKMPDCVIFIPDAGPLVIDAKFPLEAVTSLRKATTDDERRQATARVKQDVGKHVNDIAERYLIPGETQDIALMFIPSESVYAELHESFDDVMQKAQRLRVMIVSPTLMVMAIQVLKQVRKDAQIREAADQLRDEVGHLMKDVRLLADRVRKLQGHFGQTGKDIEDILTSATRIEKRATRIEGLEFDEPIAELPGMSNVIPGPVRRLEAGE